MFINHAGSKLRHCYQRQYNSCEMWTPVASGHPFDPGKSDTSRWDAIIVKCDCFVQPRGRVANQMVYRDAHPAPCHLGISGSTACSAEDPSALSMTRRLGTWDKELLTTTLVLLWIARLKNISRFWRQDQNWTLVLNICFIKAPKNSSEPSTLLSYTLFFIMSLNSSESLCLSGKFTHHV